MPDRILRAELLTSEPWLGLKNNDDRVCWIVLLLNADTLGNQPGGLHRLVHLWRHAGIDMPEKAAKVVLELADVDLIRRYEVAEKPYLHIPRFRSRLRYLQRLYPISPWTTNEEKQRIAKNSPENHSEPPALTGESPAKVVVVDVVAAGVAAKSKAKPVVASRLPSGWQLPEEWQTFAMTLKGWNEEQTLRESLVFRDYWLGKAGKDGTKVDWLATWRNWVRRSDR